MGRPALFLAAAILAASLAWSQSTLVTLALVTASHSCFWPPCVRGNGLCKQSLQRFNSLASAHMDSLRSWHF